MTYSRSYLFRLKTCLFGALLVAASFLFSPLAVAAPLGASGPAGADDPPTLIEHLRAELQHKDAVRRELALIDIVALTSCQETCTVNLRSISDKKLSIQNETGTRTVVDLEALVPDLLTTYRDGPADGHRLLALAALVNVGNEAALEQLIDEGSRQSKATNKATQRSLAAFYLKKYPELMEKTMQTRTFSIDDVRRVQAIRIRKAKKM